MKKTSLHIIQNEKGMSLVLVMILLSAVIIASGSIMSQYQSMQNYSGSLGIPESLKLARDNVQAVIDNEDAWNQTVQNNSGLACLRNQAPAANQTCPAGAQTAISIYEADGANLPYVDAGNPNRGFTMGGNPCDTFGQTGDTSCVYQYQVTWQCKLEAGVCPQTFFRPGATVASKPAIDIIAQLKVSDTVIADVARFKLTPFNLSITRGEVGSTLSKFCNMLPGGAYSQATKDCVSWYHNSDPIDCEVIGGLHWWLAGIDSAGNPICQPDQKLGKYCPPGASVVGYTAQGGFTCFLY